jgi:hypothetical protein
MRFVQNYWKQAKVVIPGKRSATRNPVPLGSGFKKFSIFEKIPQKEGEIPYFAG